MNIQGGFCISIVLILVLIGPVYAQTVIIDRMLNTIADIFAQTLIFVALARFVAIFIGEKTKRCCWKVLVLTYIPVGFLAIHMAFNMKFGSGIEIVCLIFAIIVDFLLRTRRKDIQHSN